MDLRYREFFDILPKHALLPIIKAVPSKFKKITTELLAYVFVQQGVIKKVVLDNLKECAGKIVKQQLTVVGDQKDQIDIVDMEISDECKILLDSFLFFKSKYSETVNSTILTSFVTYLMVSDDRLGCYKFFKDCIYLKEYNAVINTLYSQLSEFIGVTRSDYLIDYGEYLTDPLIYKHYDYSGREELVNECIDILCRMTKANVLLVGNAGVGKTSIAYEICNIISSVDCPEQLKRFNVFSLNFAKMVAGATFRGDLEKRLDLIVNELKAHNNIILFIDEMQEFVSKDSDSRVFQNTLKSYLSESSKIIACTNEEEYKIIESDKAFERRFTKVIVPEMTANETLNVLENKLQRYSEFHNIDIDSGLLKYIVDKCDLHIKNRYFPDKAFDVLDLSCVLCANKNYKNLSKDNIDEAVYKISNINPREKTVQHTVQIESDIKKCIFGQDHAVSSVCRAFRKYYIGVNNKSKPIACFLFVGPTGTGKTELCRQIANRFFTKESFIRYDMSEFMESHSISKLIGSPPGYVGYTAGGSLTEKIKHNPFSIILFDEIEKAHPDVVNVLLQIMDEGRLTDSFSCTVDFTNTMIVMTSNLGCREVTTKKKLGFDSSDSKYNTEPIERSIKEFFSPEFRNRLDEIIYFNPITTDLYDKIFDKELNEFLNRYKSCGIDINVSRDTYDKMKDGCFSEKDGVRFVQRAICSLLEDKITEKLLDNCTEFTI